MEWRGECKALRAMRPANPTAALLEAAAEAGERPSDGFSLLLNPYDSFRRRGRREAF